MSRTSTSTITSDSSSGAVPDPLEALDAYSVKFLPTHLAAAKRSADLFRLLTLQRGTANAWYMTKDDLPEYLLDLSLATDLALEQGDCGQVAAYRLVGVALRGAAALEPALLDAAVGAGLLSTDEALGMALSAQSSSGLPALARLLPRLPPDRAHHAVRELIAGLRSSQGQSDAREDTSRRLAADTFLDIVTRLATWEQLTEHDLTELLTVTKAAGTQFARIEAVVHVAAKLSQPDRRAAYAQAWDLAQSLDLFRGRPEALAVVAAAEAATDAGGYVDDALQSALDIVSATPERLSFNDWFRYGNASEFGMSPVLRMERFAEPFETLAPHLDADRLSTTIELLLAVGNTTAHFAVLALLPAAVAAGAYRPAAEQLPRVGGLVVVAVATLLGAGFPLPGLDIADLEFVCDGVDDPELRALSLLAVVPLLPPTDAVRRIERLIGEVTDLHARSSFRRDILARLPAVVRGLTPVERLSLIRRVDAGELQMTKAEAAGLLEPLVDLWPLGVLERELRRRRDIALPAETAEQLFRSEPPGMEPPGRPEPVLVEPALAWARGRPEAERAALLALIAPVLAPSSFAEAKEVVASISSPVLRFQPAVLLLARHPAPTADSVAEVVVWLGTVPDGLGRFGSSVDLLSAVVARTSDPSVRRAVAGLLARLSTDDVAVAAPLIWAASGPAARESVRSVRSALRTWFGFSSPSAAGDETGTATAGASSDQRRDAYRLQLDRAGAAEALAMELVRVANWSAVTALISTVAREPAVAEQVERAVVVAAAGPLAVEGVAVLRAISTDAPTAARRLEAVAALLRTTASPDVLDSPDLRPHSGASASSAYVRAAAAVVEVSLSLNDARRGAALLTFLCTDKVPYSTATARAVSRAADQMREYSDAHRREAEDEDEQWLAAYLSYVHQHGDDYELQEAAGRLLRERVAAARAAVRRPNPTWLEQLRRLADADAPGEVLLHELALSADCDAAAVLADLDDLDAAIGCLNDAVSRLARRHTRPGSLAAVRTCLTRLRETSADRPAIVARLAVLAGHLASIRT